ncbi:MAG: lipoyl protein ligase domain-containing protein, partial [Alphaproteobacteria bacterium]
MTLKSNNIDWVFSRELVHFPDALKIMEERVDNIIDGKANSKIWVLEHHPVITAGISARDEDLLEKTDIPIFKTNRGGKYTFHGPGIKIIYLMLNLKNFFS